MSKETLDELNEFLSMGGTKEKYTKKLIAIRNSLYNNEEIRLFIDVYADTEAEATGKPREEIYDYVYKLLALFVTEKLLILPEEEYGKV